MIHPSYVELMKVVNEDVAIGEEPVVNSRYSIVLATAKRAREIIESEKYIYPYCKRIGERTENMEETQRRTKPLSVAVDELYRGDVKIISDIENV